MKPQELPAPRRSEPVGRSRDTIERRLRSLSTSLGIPQFVPPEQWAPAAPWSKPALANYIGGSHTKYGLTPKVRERLSELPHSTQILSASVHGHRESYRCITVKVEDGQHVLLIARPKKPTDQLLMMVSTTRCTAAMCTQLARDYVHGRQRTMQRSSAAA